MLNPFQKINIHPEYDYNIEAVLRQRTGSKKIKYGIVWGYIDNKTYHVFEISSDGSVGVYSKESGERNQITNKVYDVTIDKKRNSLKIENLNSFTINQK